MKTRVKIFLGILVTVLIIVFLLVINNHNEYKCKEIIDTDTGISYLYVADNSYPEISLESAELGLFPQSTVDRMDDIYLYNDNLISPKESDVYIINKSTFHGTNYGYKEISENIYLYFQIDDNKILKYFACTGFELPELKIENIDHIRVEFIDYTENKPNIIKERSIIESIINNPIDYFANNQISDIYITYKNYNLEEWFDIQKLT